MILSKYQQLYLTSLTLIIGLVGIVSLQKNALETKLIKKESVSYLQEEQVLKTAVDIQKILPSFDLNNLIADWNYLQFIQYFGDTPAREVTGYSLVTDYFEVSVDKDPNFTQAYLSFSAANSLFAVQPEKTVELLNQALETVTPETPHYPFLLWTYKATDEILFLGDLEAAKNSYEMAAKWASLRQDDVGNEMAGRYQKTVKFLSSNPDPTEAQFRAWMTVLSNSQDPKTQDYILNKLRGLGAEIEIDSDGRMQVKPPNKT